MRLARFLPCAILCLAIAPLAHADETDAEAFAALSKLAGRWEGTFANGRKHTVDYRLSAGGTVLVETWTLAPGRESITMYHLDGDRLLATHYCPQGNQPRLRRVDDGDPRRLSFSFVDGTGLQAADGWHQHEFWVELRDASHYVRHETYVANVPKADAEASRPDPPVAYTRIEGASSNP